MFQIVDSTAFPTPEAPNKPLLDFIASNPVDTCFIIPPDLHHYFEPTATEAPVGTPQAYQMRQKLRTSLSREVTGKSLRLSMDTEGQRVARIVTQSTRGKRAEVAIVPSADPAQSA